MHTVCFPKLGLEFHLNPVVFSIGDFQLNWYGVLIGVGILLAMWMGFSNCKRFGIIGDKLVDVVLAGIIGGIVGARLYYVAFRWEDYKDDLSLIFRTWEGGLAIYGGIIGAFLVGGICARIRKVKVPAVMDLAAMGFLIGQGVGRWGNFVNGEAFGCNTDLPWGMTGDRIAYYLANSTHVTGTAVDPTAAVHPCFLYESIWCLIGFGLLFWYSRHRRFDGEIFLMYLGWYGLGRVFIEGLRTDSLMLGNLRVSQLLAGILVAASLITWLVIRSKIKSSNDPEYLKCYGQTEAFQQELADYEQLLKEKEEKKQARKAARKGAAAPAGETPAGAASDEGAPAEEGAAEETSAEETSEEKREEEE
ncbi:MAG: prolipoprotein diacylglyceryl transferase [Oscillospiraceae bacterium]|nr:prolipoprotein diacylglyceryl transferase [Oscillospiraceae bacterium]